jgi:hypothetical protein
VTASQPHPVPGRPAWGKLRELAAEARERRGDGLGDWEPGDIEDAVTAVETAGWTFARARAEVHRMLGDPNARPGDLRAAILADARGKGGAGLTREEREELRASALASCEAATERFAHQRRTGPMPALREPGRGP